MGDQKKDQKRERRRDQDQRFKPCMREQKSAKGARPHLSQIVEGHQKSENRSAGILSRGIDQKKQRKGTIVVGILSIVSGIWGGVAGYFWCLSMAFSSDGMQYYGSNSFKKFLYDAGMMVISVEAGGTIIATTLFIIGGLLLIWNRKWRWVSLSGIYVTYLICLNYLWYVLVSEFYHVHVAAEGFQFRSLYYISVPVIAVMILPVALQFILNREKTCSVN